MNTIGHLAQTLLEVLTFGFVKRILMELVLRAKTRAKCSPTSTGDRHAKSARNTLELIERRRHKANGNQTGQVLCDCPVFHLRSVIDGAQTND